MTKPLTKPPVSTILENKAEEDILSPTAIPFYLTPERRYDIYPMPDGVLMLVANDLEQIVRLVDGVLGQDGFKLEPRDLLPLVPQIVKFLIPNATRIIAACLQLSEAFVSRNFTVAKRLEALTLIVQAEDLPLILKNWTALLTTFQPTAPETTQPEG